SGEKLRVRDAPCRTLPPASFPLSTSVTFQEVPERSRLCASKVASTAPSSPRRVSRRPSTRAVRACPSAAVNALARDITSGGQAILVAAIDSVRMRKPFPSRTTGPVYRLEPSLPLACPPPIPSVIGGPDLARR